MPIFVHQVYDFPIQAVPGTSLLFIVLLCSGVMGFAFTHDSRLKMIDYQGAVPYNVYSFLLPCHLPCIFWFVTKLHYALININYIYESRPPWSTMFAGALFLFFATFTSTIALGKHINDVTHGVTWRDQLKSLIKKESSRPILMRFTFPLCTAGIFFATGLYVCRSLLSWGIQSRYW